MDTHTNKYNYTCTVTLATHARRGLIIIISVNNPLRMQCRIMTYACADTCTKIERAGLVVKGLYTCNSSQRSEHCAPSDNTTVALGPWQNQR